MKHLLLLTLLLSGHCLAGKIMSFYSSTEGKVVAVLSDSALEKEPEIDHFEHLCPGYFPRLFPSASDHFRLDGARPERPPGGGGSGRGDPITQMFYGDSALGRLIREALMMLLDTLVKSPLEEDFGETSDWDIVLPEARHAIELPPDVMAERLARLCAEVAGFSGEHAEKIGVRMRELPVGMFADYRYQIPDGGSTAELQIRMTKRQENLIAMELRSSEAVIGAVRMAFRGARGDTEEDTDE